MTDTLPCSGDRVKNKEKSFSPKSLEYIVLQGFGNIWTFFFKLGVLQLEVLLCQDQDIPNKTTFCCNNYFIKTGQNSQNKL